MKTRKKLKKERFAKKKESISLTESYGNTIKLRLKAKEELKILIDLFSRDNDNETDAFKEIKFHLEASQKELTYFGFRGITIGIIVVLLTNIIITKGLPIMFDISEQLGKFQSLLEKSIWFAFIVVMAMLLIGFFMVAFYQFASPILRKEKKIREQIYINEYMIKMVEEKIKLLCN